MNPLGVLLSLEAIGVSYRRGRRELPVLADVSLEVTGGEVLAVLAKRAQGKSTLLRVAAGMQRPDGGRVLFEGEDLWDLANTSRQRLARDGIGWVQTSTPELNLTMLDHVVAPLLDGVGKEEAHTRARTALERVGAMGCAEQHWESMLDSERALVAVAVGIVRRPRLLVVDDLFSTLGLGETEEVARLLYEVSRETGAGVLMGVSDANATAWSDRLTTLAGGELVMVPALEEAPEGELIDFPGRGERSG